MLKTVPTNSSYIHHRCIKCLSQADEVTIQPVVQAPACDGPFSSVYVV